MLTEKCFSLPINPKSDWKFIQNTFIPFLEKNRDVIYDLYFTCRIAPFGQDAMGDVFTSDPRGVAKNALWIEKQVGIPLSATFNNIWVRPDQKNLDLWIENFKPLYDRGVKIVTLPHTSWVLTGQIQKEFPELYIKNTILREVTRPNEIVQLAEAGFHYINLDRDLMRDRDQLERIMKAKEHCASIGKPVKISLLTNEGCWGGCPIMPEHYQYNSTRQGDEPHYFNDIMSRVSCSTWEYTDPAVSLKAANIPPWRSDWQEFLDLGIDVFKMHGRESHIRLKESMDLITRWNNGDEILYPQLDPYIDDLGLKKKYFTRDGGRKETVPILDSWREKIKNCKFDCWDCHYCDSVVEAHMKKQDRILHPFIDRCLKSINDAEDNTSKFTGHGIEGFSSDKVRHLLNNLCSYDDTKYLEVGVYKGSTFCAAIQNNDVTAYAADHWLDKDIKPIREDIEWSDEEPSIDIFIKNVKENWTDNSNIAILNGDIREATEENLDKKVNTVFYDADHDFWVQKYCLDHVLKYTEDEFILIVDDANQEEVVKSLEKFIQDNNLEVLYKRVILTEEVEDSDTWWNGLAIAVIKK